MTYSSRRRIHEGNEIRSNVVASLAINRKKTFINYYCNVNISFCLFTINSIYLAFAALNND